MASASALPAKEFSNYAATELKRFVYEAGRVYGNLQCDQETAFTAAAKAVANEIGGSKFRLASRASSQSQGSVER